VDGCTTKAPCGGQSAGPSPVDRRKQGLKRSTVTEAGGLPLGAVPAPAHHRDDGLLAVTLDTLTAVGPLPALGAAHARADRRAIEGSARARPPYYPVAIGRAGIAAAGGADRRSAKNADRPMNQSREAHHAARPHHSPEGASSLGRSETINRSDQAIPCHRHAPTERPARRHARDGMTLAPAASGYGTHLSRGPGMCSVSAMRPAQHRAIPDTPRPTLLLSRAIRALVAG
jgi:hypothetical protein